MSDYAKDQEGQSDVSDVDEFQNFLVNSVAEIKEDNDAEVDDELENEEVDDESEDDEDDDDSEDDSEDDDSDDDEGDDKEGDSEDDGQFSSKDLTSFPKALRKDIGKMPRNAQSKLVGWLHNQNEDKRKVVAESKLVGSEYVQYREDVEKRHDLYGSTVKELVGALNKSASSDEVKELLDKFETNGMNFLRASGDQFWNNKVAAVMQQEAPALARFLGEQGIKDTMGWYKKNPELYAILTTAVVYSKTPESKKKFFNIVSSLISNQKKTRSKGKRPAKKSSSKKNRGPRLNDVFGDIIGNTFD